MTLATTVGEECWRNWNAKRSQYSIVSSPTCGIYFGIGGNDTLETILGSQCYVFFGWVLLN